MATTVQKVILWLFVALFILSAALYTRFYTLGKASQTMTAPGIEIQQLMPCPDSPNCISTEQPEDHSHYLPPLIISGTNWQNLKGTLKSAVQQDGGSVTQVLENYMAVEYQTGWFGFVDDLEFRYDSEKQLLHMRSASRVGYSDLGCNHERVQRISKTIQTLIESANAQRLDTRSNSN
jgi:uncharacterized protein (DUF1499 family)